MDLVKRTAKALRQTWSPDLLQNCVNRSHLYATEAQELSVEALGCRDLLRCDSIESEQRNYGLEFARKDVKQKTTNRDERDGRSAHVSRPGTRDDEIDFLPLRNKADRILPRIESASTEADDCPLIEKFAHEPSESMVLFPGSGLAISVATLTDLVELFKRVEDESDVALRAFRKFDQEFCVIGDMEKGDILCVEQGLCVAAPNIVEAVGVLARSDLRRLQRLCEDPIVAFNASARLAHPRLHREDEKTHWGMWPLSRNDDTMFDNDDIRLCDDGNENCTFVHVSCYRIIVALTKLRKGDIVRVRRPSEMGISSRSV